MQGSQMNVIIVPSTNAYSGRVISLFKGVTFLQVLIKD